jgi:catechol 2,3-dioxygenase-like lactoylglutathione lyase family enzyme
VIDRLSSVRAVGANAKFELRGVNHVALVSSDMARTVRFYRDVLGMPLVKTIDLPDGAQHFFFDIGNDDCLAFFWFPGAQPAQPGLASPAALPGAGDFTTAHGSLNHLAFDVPLERFEEYRQRLADEGVAVSAILDHDDSEYSVARAFHPDVFVRSFYFFDPDGILLEFAAWTRAMGRPDDVAVRPVDRSGTHVEV